jgi:2-keto-4-pentenoate hydratase
LSAALVEALLHARHGGPLLRAADWADAVKDDSDAYAVQDGVAAALGWPQEGVVRHWKSGGASRSGPFSHAPLDPAWVGTGFDTRRPMLGVEAEIALRLARPVSPEQARQITAENAFEWVDAMCIAVEGVAARWAEGLAAPALLRMADHQCHAALWLGPWQDFEALDWASMGWRLREAGAPDIERRGGHSLADPCRVSPAWLQHLSRHGASVAAGSVVTTGAWGGLHVLADTTREISLSFEGLGACRFSL